MPKGNKSAYPKGPRTKKAEREIKRGQKAAMRDALKDTKKKKR